MTYDIHSLSDWQFDLKLILSIITISEWLSLYSYWYSWLNLILIYIYIIIINIIIYIIINIIIMSWVPQSLS